MRSIEYLIQLYPDKTGAEILKIQGEDKLKDEAAYKKANEKQIAFVEDINTNGGFWKGKFGLDQHFYYKVTNAKMDSGHVYGDVENLTVFFGCKNGVISDGSIELKKQFNRCEKLENYGFSLYERTTEKDYEAAVKYVNDFKLFWK